jgi:hypothetical protein
MAFQQRLMKSYESNGGKNVGALPWAAIIQALLSIFGNCPVSRTKRWARRNPEAAKEAINDRLLEGGYFSSTKDRKITVDSSYKDFLATPDSELESMR